MRSMPRSSRAMVRLIAAGTLVGCVSSPQDGQWSSKQPVESEPMPVVAYTPTPLGSSLPRFTSGEIEPRAMAADFIEQAASSPDPQIRANAVEASQYAELREALEKLRLNDASFFFEPETSAALGFGFRCGFLGLLHMEIVQERLEREFDMDLVTTAPGVLYRVTTTDGELIEIDTPSKLPDASRIEKIEEPIITAMIMTPSEHVGAILQLCQEKRGVQKSIEYLKSDRVLITYEIPFNEVVMDFYDRLKTISRGYASLDYHVTGYQEAPLVKLDILVNEEPVDALSVIVHKDSAYARGRALASKMRELIPRQMFEIAIQAAVGSRIIARETVKALRKNVLAKCYGGDISRKRKLLEKQKEGKKRMKRVGRVEIPQEAFLAVLKVGQE